MQRTYDTLAVGQRVKALRLAAGLTQQGLADAAGLSGNVYISEIERGLATGLSVDVLIGLSAALADGTDRDQCDVICHLLIGQRDDSGGGGDRLTREVASIIDKLSSEKRHDLLLLAQFWRSQELRDDGAPNGYMNGHRSEFLAVA